MEIVINDGLLPSNGLEQILSYAILSANGANYHIGKYGDLKRHFKNVPLEEITNLDNLDLSDINLQNTIIITDPDEDLMMDAKLHELLCNQKDIVSNVIVTMKRATNRESPYNDLSLPFFYRLMTDYVLLDTHEIKVRSTRYDHEYAYDHKIYHLVKNENAEDSSNTLRNSIYSVLERRLNSDDEHIFIKYLNDFPNFGFIKIDDEIISYMVNDGQKLTKLGRGRHGTSIPPVHMTGVGVKLFTPKGAVRRMPLLLAENK